MMLPSMIEELDYESSKLETTEYLKNRTGIDINFLESDDVSLIIDAFLYREMLLRSRINESAKASYLFTATGNDLDLIAYGYMATRLEGETDDRLRERCLLSLYQFSTAGARNSYKFYARSVSNEISQVEVLTPTPGTVEIVYHSAGNYDNSIITALNGDDIRPLTDTVKVTKATVKIADITLSVEVLSGYDIIVVRQNITEAFAMISLGIGEDLPLSKIYDTAHVEGVYKITTTAADVIAGEREVIQPNILFN